MQLTHCKLSLRNMDFRLSTNIQQLLCKKQNKTKLIEKRVKKKKKIQTIKQSNKAILLIVYLIVLVLKLTNLIIIKFYCSTLKRGDTTIACLRSCA